MNAEIIAIGSELLLGQIANTNAQFLSLKLAQNGINVFYHTVVGDNSNRLKEVLEIAQKRSNLIIFTGGLGPTKDDLTKETIATVLNRKLVMDEDALAGIYTYFKKTNRPMSENNKKQALVIDGSTILSNDYGMAPGMAFKTNGMMYMLLPGPPKELHPMFENYGIAFINSFLEQKEAIESRVLRFFGIGESLLETKLEDLIDAQSNPTIAPLAGDGEVTLRLTAKHQSVEKAHVMLDQLEQKISERVGQYLYGYDKTSLPLEVFNELKQQSLTIASAESITGGTFLEQLTEFPGASQIVKGGVVCYTNEMKQHLVNVSKNTLQQYGAVSKECAQELAMNIRDITASDIGISFTGIAGPSQSEGKPVGLVYIGIALSNQPAHVMELNLAGRRGDIRNRTVKHGCFELLKRLRNNRKI